MLSNMPWLIQIKPAEKVPHYQVLETHFIAMQVVEQPKEVRQVGKFTKTVMGSGNIAFSTAKAKPGKIIKLWTYYYEVCFFTMDISGQK